MRGRHYMAHKNKKNYHPTLCSPASGLYSFNFSPFEKQILLMIPSWIAFSFDYYLEINSWSECESCVAMSTLMTSRCETRLLSTRIVPISTSQWGCMRVPISTHMTSYFITSYDDILSQPWNDLKLNAHILATQITVHFIITNPQGRYLPQTLPYECDVQT